MNFAARKSVLRSMRHQLARLILTGVLLGGAAASFALDWGANHLLNPAWPGHAKFHGALLLFTLAGVSLTGVWLLWRDSREPQVAITAAALIAASFWTPLFYITSLLPGSTAWAGNPRAVPHVGGMTFYPNLAVAAAFLCVTAGAWFMGRRTPAVGR
jgi:hypothetical protein